MMISTTRNSSAFTLLEILLAIGLAAILALVAIPAMDGWWSEYRMLDEAGGLIEVVQRAKLVAEKEGRRQVVVLLSEGEQRGWKANNGVHLFVCDGLYSWKLFRFDGAQDTRPHPSIGIDSRGRVEPMTFSLEAAGRTIQYRFDFLTGHAKEEGYSL